VRVTAIIAAGGAGRRLGAAVPKQMLEVAGRSILERSVEAFAAHPHIAETIVVLPPDLAQSPPEWLSARAPRVRVVAGGPRRQDSVAIGFDAADTMADVVLVHDAARPFVTAAVISRVIEAAAAYGAAIAAIPVSDTVKRAEQAAGSTDPIIVETIPRATLYLAQTPQGFARDVLREAVALGRSGVDATDEASLVERAGHSVRVVHGAASNVKITTVEDLEAASRAVSGGGRIGMGYDLHRLVPDRRLIVGGVEVPSATGALGHSDADVVCHAITDALLGAASAGDIGEHFPDTDPQWKDASSIALLRQVVELVRTRGFEILNVDVVIVLERPKLGPYRARISDSLATTLGIDSKAVSVKAKTNEGVDAVGRGEAIVAHAVALLRSRHD
jgi:2-C-methyl-D-erythritol 4-phosphate cytidylyltransferase/2-C-methyl-D-erythritol 2,4-cyclodiphosphate synthase